jgi:hypothetical protein
MRRSGVAVASVCALLVSARIAGAVTQPDGTVVPTKMGCDSGHPTGLGAVFASQCTSGGPNIGAACPGNVDPASCDKGQHGTCESTIWHNWNDDSCIPSNLSGLSPITDAATTPETFQPTCALTFTVASRGTAQFHDVFGWYNVTGAKPDPSDLHVMLACNAVAGSHVVLDLRSDPAYKGGEIGFFIATPEARAQHKTCDGGDCCASVARLATAGYLYYSQRAFNPDAGAGAPFVHLLVYDSKIAAHRFYFAWEDLFAGGGNNDFNDLVTSVDGVECSGGGLACDTGMPGLCAEGLSVCADGAIQCNSLWVPRDEICDGADQDCDGQVDEGATCPDSGWCDHGVCRPNCNTAAEFPCEPPTTCDQATGACVDPQCAGVVCPSGAACVAGACVTPCDGVTCPHGDSCVQGRCIDRCANVACPTGEICLEGACFAGCGSCDGVQCASGLVCGSGGQCADPSCPNGCAAGSHCASGTCVDDCQGAVCPGQQVCQAGACVDPSGPGGPGPDGGTGPGGNGNGGPGAPACSCASGRGGSGSGLVIAGAIALVLRRRRRAS